VSPIEILWCLSRSVLSLNTTGIRLITFLCLKCGVMNWWCCMGILQCGSFRGFFLSMFLSLCI